MLVLSCEVGSKTWVMGLGLILGLAALLVWTCRVVELVCWRPRRLERGLAGTDYRLLYGDLNDLAWATRAARTRPMGVSHATVSWVIPFYQNAMKKHDWNDFISHCWRPSWAWPEFCSTSRSSSRHPTPMLRTVITLQPQHGAQLILHKL